MWITELRRKFATADTNTDSKTDVTWTIERSLNNDATSYAVGA